MGENKKYKMLILNPGSTSTKLGFYENEEKVKETVIRHNKADIEKCATLFEQQPMRMKCIDEFMEELGYKYSDLDSIVSRGGFLRPIESGTYAINDLMYEDLHGPVAKLHASALGGVIAYEVSKKENIPCFVIDPVVVDEMDDRARLSGHEGIVRKSAFHALNQKAVARKHAKVIGKKYEECRFVVAHMGGGISVGAHKYGKVVDVNDALCGEGPFSPERSGTLPLMAVIQLCFSGNYKEKETIEMFTKSSGMLSYLGTNDFRKCEDMYLEGDEKATLVFRTMAYQVAKEIGAMSAVLEGEIDAIILTGGMTYAPHFNNEIIKMVGKFAPVAIYKGEMEMEALAAGAYRVLSGQEEAKVY